MNIEVRPIGAAEATAYRRAVRAGFGVAHTVDDGDWAVATTEPLERALVALDGEAMVATLRSFPTELTVPGGTTVPAGALTAVTCRATHRRQGLLTRMITADLAGSVERGEPVAVLIASEFPIYGRFGYGPAAHSVSWQLDATAARFTNPGRGTIEFATDETFRKEAPAVFERVRAARPGMIGRNEFVWDLRADLRRPPEDKAWSGFRVLCRDDDGIAVGWANYTMVEKWDDFRARHTADVADLCAATPAAEARLWRFLAELDLVTRVRARDRPVDDTLPWLLHDARAVKETNRHDFLWVRPLDVAAMLTSRRYPATGRVTVGVTDAQGFATGRFVLEASPEGATCSPTSAAAELTVPVMALGAAFLGGVPVRTLHAAGWLDEHAPGAVARADALFAGDVMPWCNTWF